MGLKSKFSLGISFLFFVAVLVGCNGVGNSSSQENLTPTQQQWLYNLESTTNQIHSIDPSVLQQPVNDVNQLLLMAIAESFLYYPKINNICNSIMPLPCETKFPNKGKDLSRIEEKVTDGKYDKIYDYSRATIIVSCNDTIKTLNSMIANFEESNLVRVKNRINNPVPGGYRDILILSRDSTTGMISELLILTPEMFGIKNGEGHRLYELVRTIEDNAKNEKRELTPEENTLINSYNEQQKQLYGRAYKACLQSIN